VTRDDGIVPYEPEPGVEYAGFRVVLTGTYAGEGDSSIAIDFNIEHVGTDGRVYANYAGGTQTIEYSLAVPTSALGGGVITLESDWDANTPRWSAGI